MCEERKATYEAVWIALDYQYFKEKCPKASKEMLMFLISQVTQIRVAEKRK